MVVVGVVPVLVAVGAVVVVAVVGVAVVSHAIAVYPTGVPGTLGPATPLERIRMATQTQTPGYSASKDQLLKRLARVEGQVRGVARMVEEDRYCVDVLTQISAARAALDQIALGLLDGHTRTCLLGEGQGPAGADAQADELMGAVGRMLSR